MGSFERNEEINILKQKIAETRDILNKAALNICESKKYRELLIKSQEMDELINEYFNLLNK